METVDLALPWYMVGKNAIHESGASNLGRLIVKQGPRQEHPEDGVSSAGNCCVAPKSSSLRADRAELASSQRLREDAVVNQGESIPFTGARVLGLEVPEDPSIGVLLKGFKLSLDVSANVIAPGLVPRANVVLVGARVHKPRTSVDVVRSIVTRANTVAVEPGGAVGDGS